MKVDGRFFGQARAIQSRSLHNILWVWPEHSVFLCYNSYMNNLPVLMIAFSAFILLAAILFNRDTQPIEVYCKRPVAACETKTNCQLPPLPPKGHVRVRIGVGINDQEDWAAGGGSGMTRWEMLDEVLAKGDSLRWIVADIPVAGIPPEVSATVKVE